MQRPGEAERLWWPRARWRLRGAWQWPAFVVLTPIDGVVIAELPFYEEGPGGLLPGVLLAGFVNLFCLAVIAPRMGRVLRRRRPDLPRLVAADYAGAGTLVAVTALLLLGGVLHRPAVADEAEARRAAVIGAHDYVLLRRPEYRPGLASIDALRLERDLYRVCVPGPDPKRWLCLFVDTGREPPGVKLDVDRSPNSLLRVPGGFQ
jgi:hypothetical protein